MSHHVVAARMLSAVLALYLGTPCVAHAQTADSSKQPAAGRAKPKDPQRSGTAVRGGDDPQKHAPLVTTELGQKQPTTVQKQGERGGAPTASVRAEGTKAEPPSKQLPNDRPASVGKEPPAKLEAAPLARDNGQGKGAPIDKARARGESVTVRSDGVVGAGKGEPRKNGDVRGTPGSAEHARSAAAQSDDARPPRDDTSHAGAAQPPNGKVNPVESLEPSTEPAPGRSAHDGKARGDAKRVRGPRPSPGAPPRVER